jgi:hypothetical protein
VRQLVLEKEAVAMMPVEREREWNRKSHSVELRLPTKIPTPFGKNVVEAERVQACSAAQLFPA